MVQRTRVDGVAWVLGDEPTPPAPPVPHPNANIALVKGCDVDKQGNLHCGG